MDSIDNVIKSTTGRSDLSIAFGRAMSGAINRDKRMSKWEIDFVFDLGERCRKYHHNNFEIFEPTLSERQKDAIYGIANKMPDRLSL